MSIIEKIKQTVESATGMPFYYDTPETLNMRMSGASAKRPWCFPCAMLHIVTSGAIADENGIIRERLTVEVLFAQNSDLDFDGVQVETCELDEMKHKAFAWLVYLRTQARTNGVRLISSNGTNRYYATDDAIFSAYGVNVTLEEVEGVSKCTTP